MFYHFNDDAINADHGEEDEIEMMEMRRMMRKLLLMCVMGFAEIETCQGGKKCRRAKLLLLRRRREGLS